MSRRSSTSSDLEREQKKERRQVSADDLRPQLSLKWSSKFSLDSAGESGDNKEERDSAEERKCGEYQEEAEAEEEEDDDEATEWQIVEEVNHIEDDEDTAEKLYADNKSTDPRFFCPTPRGVGPAPSNEPVPVARQRTEEGADRAKSASSSIDRVTQELRGVVDLSLPYVDEDSSSPPPGNNSRSDPRRSMTELAPPTPPIRHKQPTMLSKLFLELADSIAGMSPSEDSASPRPSSPSPSSLIPSTPLVTPVGAFILTYKIHGTSRELFRIVEKAYREELIITGKGTGNAPLVFLKQWVLNAPSDFSDFGEDEAAMLRSIFGEAELSKAEKEEIEAVLKYPSLKPPKPMKKSIFNYNPGVLAKALTMIEWRIFEKIQPSELLSQKWQQQNCDKVSPNVSMFTRRCNQLSSWVASKVLLASCMDERTHILESFIDVMHKMHSHQNYNGAITILGGLNMACIRRLRKLWKAIGGSARDRYNAVDLFFSPSNNFSKYRNTLSTWLHTRSETIREQSSRSKSTTPRSGRRATISVKIEKRSKCIPYLAVILRDLIHLDENARTDTKSEMHKMLMIANALQTLRLCQEVGYNYEEDEVLCHYLMELPGCQSEDDLYQVSLEIQPRTSSSSHDSLPIRQPNKRSRSQDSSTISEVVRTLSQEGSMASRLSPRQNAAMETAGGGLAKGVARQRSSSSAEIGSMSRLMDGERVVPEENSKIGMSLSLRDVRNTSKESNDHPMDNDPNSPRSPTRRKAVFNLDVESEKNEKKAKRRLSMKKKSKKEKAVEKGRSVDFSV